MLNPQSPKDAWAKRTTLDGPHQDQMTEVWEYRGETHCVDVTVGKRLDVLSLKGTSLREIREYAAFLEKSAARLYARDAPRNALANCPCCGQATGGASVAMRVFEVPYVRCHGCGHVYVSEQPSQSVLDALFTESALHSSEYTDIDPVAQDFRIRQIAEPKLDWARRQYERVFNRAPTSLVDVGAGGGHFVTAAARAGLPNRWGSSATCHWPSCSPYRSSSSALASCSRSASVKPSACQGITRYRTNSVARITRRRCPLRPPADICT